MGYVGKVQTNDGALHLVGSTLYGTCDTLASVAAKVVTCPDFTTLYTGVTIHVIFTNSNSVSSATMNVNSTGAKPIMLYGTTQAGIGINNSWPAGAVCSFTYDGTNWRMNDYQIPVESYISYSEFQSLTSSQQTIARSNIGLSRIVVENATVASASWTLETNPTYAAFPYKAEISVTGATANMIPEVIFSPTDAVSGNYAPVALTSTNTVTIYAKESGVAAITIPTILVH